MWSGKTGTLKNTFVPNDVSTMDSHKVHACIQACCPTIETTTICLVNGRSNFDTVLIGHSAFEKTFQQSMANCYPLKCITS